MIHIDLLQSRTSSPGMKHELDDFDYVDVEGEDPGAPRVTKKELLEEGGYFATNHFLFFLFLL